MLSLSPGDMVFGSLKYACETPGARGERAKNWPRREDCSIIAPEGGIVGAGIQFGRSGIIDAIGLICDNKTIA